MHHAAKLSFTLLVAAGLTVACGGDPPPAPTKVAEAAAGPVAEVDVATPGGAPEMTVDEPVHDFGAIKATDTAEHVFTIRNTGDADLKIERVERT